MQSLYNTLKMLDVLSRSKVIKTSELSEMLEVSPRQIRRYKTDLMDAGIGIDSVPGREGGLKLADSVGVNGMLNCFNGVFSVNDSQETIQSRNLKLLKILSRSLTTDDEIHQSPLMKKLEKCYRAIEMQRTLVVDYTSPYSGTSHREIHPLFILEKFDRLYLVAKEVFSEKVKVYRINRFSKIMISDRQVEVDREFVDLWKRKYEGAFGIYTDQETWIRLQVRYPQASAVLEDFSNIKMRIVEDDKHHIILEVKVNGMIEITKYILQQGSAVVVIDPPELKASVQSEIERMRANYG